MSRAAPRAIGLGKIICPFLHLVKESWLSACLEVGRTVPISIYNYMFELEKPVPSPAQPELRIPPQRVARPLPSAKRFGEPRIVSGQGSREELREG